VEVRRRERNRHNNENETKQNKQSSQSPDETGNFFVYGLCRGSDIEAIKVASDVVNGTNERASRETDTQPSGMKSNDTRYMKIQIRQQFVLMFQSVAIVDLY
jgi:hypothetical protein